MTQKQNAFLETYETSVSQRERLLCQGTVLPPIS
jgi:hypothetical protein